MKVSGACHCGKIQIKAVLIEGKVLPATVRIARLLQEALSV